MGWKKLKQAFDIRHIVHVNDGNILIGSGYISDLLSISPDGKIKANDCSPSFGRQYYPALMDASESEVASLIADQDTFEQSLPVYTYKDAEIIEKQCDEYGWPNVTHDGELMYENMFFSEKDKAVSAAKKNVIAWQNIINRHQAHLENQLAKSRIEATTANIAIEKLNTDYPDIA